MSRRAAIVLATHHRRRLLDLCLARLMRQVVPEDWTYEVYVSGSDEDFGRAVAAKHSTRWRQSPTELIGHKLREAVQAADADGAELILWVGDDDLQPADRLAAAIEAHQAGAWGSGVHGYWYLDTATGRVAWWRGAARWYGAGVALRTEAWRRIGLHPLPVTVGEEVRTVPDPEAWDIERAAEPWLYSRTWLDPARLRPAHRRVGRGVVCLCHGRNLTSRPFPERGRRGGERAPVLDVARREFVCGRPRVGLLDVVGMGSLPDDVPQAFPRYEELWELVREAQAGRL